VSSAANETASSDAVVRVTSDAGSASSATVMSTSSETLPARPLIPLGQGWLPGSGKR